MTTPLAYAPYSLAAGKPRQAYVNDMPRAPQPPRYVKKGRPTGFVDPDRAAQFAALYADGKTMQEIADQFGVSRERVRQILRKSGVKPDGVARVGESLKEQRVQGKAKRLALRAKIDSRKDIRKAICAAYLIGDKLAVIASRFGYSIGGVMNVVHVAGIVNRAPPETNDRRLLSRKGLAGFDRSAIVQRYLAGETARALAVELGVHTDTVINWSINCGARKQPKRNRTIAHDLATAAPLSGSSGEGGARIWSPSHARLVDNLVHRRSR